MYQNQGKKLYKKKGLHERTELHRRIGGQDLSMTKVKGIQRLRKE